MKRKLVLALALMSALGVATSGAIAQSDEKKDEKQSELVAQSDEKKDEKQSELIAQSDEKKDEKKSELIAEADDNFPKGSTPELIA
jgi:anionic cell wall polymer biosynthesis LytR-Cps2A-Psr (LCP) family protein